MLTFVLGWVILMTLGTIAGFLAARRAPVGYQDESGFHYGPETEVHEPAQEFHGALPAFSR